MTPRQDAKVDTNQPEIVAALRRHGYDVLVISHAHKRGGGGGDLVVSGFHRYAGIVCSVIVEIKSPGQDWNDAERAWYDKLNYQGAVLKAHYVEDILWWFGDVA